MNNTETEVWQLARELAMRIHGLNPEAAKKHGLPSEAELQKNPEPPAAVTGKPASLGSKIDRFIHAVERKHNAPDAVRIQTPPVTI